MSKYTPGAWEIGAETIYDQIEIRKYDTIIALVSSWATSGDLTTNKEALANARLIAAAPTMYEALLALQAGFIDGSISFTKKRQSDSDPYHPANILMTEAIAKAEAPR